MTNILSKIFFILLIIISFNGVNASPKSEAVISIINDSKTSFKFINFEPSTSSTGEPIQKLVSYDPEIYAGTGTPSKVVISSLPSDANTSATVNYASEVDAMCKFSFTPSFNSQGDLFNLSCSFSKSCRYTCGFLGGNSIIIRSK